MTHIDVGELGNIWFGTCPLLGSVLLCYQSDPLVQKSLEFQLRSERCQPFSSDLDVQQTVFSTAKLPSHEPEM